jgi:hypothetical protein
MIVNVSSLHQLIPRHDYPFVGNAASEIVRRSVDMVAGSSGRSLPGGGR